MTQMNSANDMIFKQPARFSLRLAFPRAALVAGTLIGVVKYVGFDSIFVLAVVIFLPVLSVGFFSALTRRDVYVFAESERTIGRSIQWYWFKPKHVECNSFDDIAESSVVRYEGEETWWLVYVVLRDGRRFELAGDRNRDKANQVQADLEQLVGCSASDGAPA